MSDIFNQIHRLSKQGEYDRALDLLLDKSGGRINAPYDEDLNHAWYVAGDLYHKKGDFQTAAKAFDKAVADRPDDPEALLALANCYFELEMPGVAERYLRIALRHSDDIGLIYNLGNALFDQGRYDEALVEYRRVPPDAGEIYEMAQRNIAVARERLADQ